MPNYKSQPVAGEKWRRSFNVNVKNPYKAAPTIEFSEEDIVDVGDDFISKSVPGVLRAKFNPNEEIQLIHPETAQPLGKYVTHMELYIILNSLYRSLAKRRDEIEAMKAKP